MKTVAEIEAIDHALDKVLEQPDGPTRWRPAVDLLYKSSAPARIEIDATVNEIREIRKVMKNKVGETQGSGGISRRHSLDVPQRVWDFLEKTSPMFASMHKDRKKSKQIVRQLMQTFPEFCVAEKI